MVATGGFPFSEITTSSALRLFCAYRQYVAPHLRKQINPVPCFDRPGATASKLIGSVPHASFRQSAKHDDRPSAHLDFGR